MQPQPNLQGLVFTPHASPTITIDELDASGNDVLRVATFTMESGLGGELIHAESDHYHVNWRTTLSNLSSIETYRIRAPIPESRGGGG